MFTANTTAPTPVQAVSTTLGGNQYRILNSGTVTVFMGVGSTAALSTSNATVITSTSATIPILAGTDEILTFSPNSYFTGITAASTAVVYLTPGDGS
jgi:hypothetical protein